MVVGILVLIVIIVVAFLVAGTQISAFVNDTFASFGVEVRDSEIKIDAPKQGEIICDMFVIVLLRYI